MSSVLDKRLLWITGKGGVGKSTVAAALGLAGARRGRRTIVCEVAEQERLSRLFRHEGISPGDETHLSDGLWATTVDPRRALAEWLRTQVGPLARALDASNAFQYFVAAAPGAREVVTMVKCWELTQQRRWDRRARAYDLVIVDAPASGHGVSMLRTPRTFADIARVGPIHSQARRVRDFLADRAATGYLAVALAEEMPVTETLELDDRLSDQVGRRLEAVVVNALYPRRFSAEQLSRVRAAALADADGAATAITGAARAAGAEYHRRRGQQAQLQRLRVEARRQGDASVVTLPYLFEPELDLDDVERLAAELDRKL